MTLGWGEILIILVVVSFIIGLAFRPARARGGSRRKT